MTGRKRLASAALAALVTLASAGSLVACSSDSDPDPTGPTTGSSPAGTSGTEGTTTTDSPDSPESPESPDNIVESLAQSMYKSSRNDPILSMTEPQATCFAQGLVDTLGTERLSSLGLSGDDANDSLTALGLSDTEARGFVTHMFDCGVVTREKVFKAINRSTGEAGKNPTFKACLESTLTDKTIKKFLKDQLKGKEVTSPELQRDLAACVAEG